MPFYRALSLQFRFAKATRVKRSIEEAACAVQINSLQREIRSKRLRLQEIKMQKRVLSDDVQSQLGEFVTVFQKRQHTSWKQFGKRRRPLISTFSPRFPEATRTTPYILAIHPPIPPFRRLKVATSRILAARFWGPPLRGRK